MVLLVARLRFAVERDSDGAVVEAAGTAESVGWSQELGSWRSVEQASGGFLKPL